MKQINVVSEFASLKAVVLAQSQFCFPEDQDGGAETSFLTEANAVLAEKSAGMDLAEVDPKIQKNWENEKKKNAAAAGILWC